jgi:predicted phage-related endonuclease
MTTPKNPLTKQEKLLEKDRIKMFNELEREKLQLINKIKNQTKEDILPKKPEKKSLWKRIIKVLMG